MRLTKDNRKQLFLVDVEKNALGTVSVAKTMLLATVHVHAKVVLEHAQEQNILNLNYFFDHNR